MQVAVQAEFELGAAKEFDTILGVWWGTGVGGGLILDGKPWLGRGAAAEIGHVVVKMGGARCTCGRKGCMEAYAGRMAMEIKARKEVHRGAKTKLFEIMEERDRDRLTSGVWERALQHGDDLATRLIDRAVKALGAGVASCVNVIDPEAVIIGGGLGSRFGEKYVRRIAARMHPHLFVDERPPAIRLAALGDLGGGDRRGAARRRAGSQHPRTVDPPSGKGGGKMAKVEGTGTVSTDLGKWWLVGFSDCSRSRRACLRSSTRTSRCSPSA